MVCKLHKYEMCDQNYTNGCESCSRNLLQANVKPLLCDVRIIEQSLHDLDYMIMLREKNGHNLSLEREALEDARLEIEKIKAHFA